MVCDSEAMRRSLKFIPIYVGPLSHVRLLETFNINFIVQAYPEIISGRVNHKALSTEKYSRYINIFYYFYYIIINWKDTLHGFLRNETTFFSLNFKWKIVKKVPCHFLFVAWLSNWVLKWVNLLGYFRKISTVPNDHKIDWNIRIQWNLDITSI